MTMNKFQQLAIETDVWCDQNGITTSNPNYNNQWEQKFGQLIVEQCASLVKETRWSVPPSQQQIAYTILQHFDFAIN